MQTNRRRMIIVLLVMIGGCEKSSPPSSAPSVSSSPPETVSGTEAPSETSKSPPPAELLQQAEASLRAGDADEARRLLDEARTIGASSDDQQRLRELEAALAALAEREADAEREAHMRRVPELISQGQFDEATAALDAVAARKPTDEQAEQVKAHRREIDRLREAQRKLGTWMKLLASKNRADFRAAQSALLEEPEAAIPLLLAALRETGDKQRTVNVLETLRQLRNPAVALPAIVGVLQRPEQRDCWPEAVDTLSRISEEGAGPMLLALFAASQDAEQRAAALTALSRVPDPPKNTFLTLLPGLTQDGPELKSLLLCAAQAARRHGQTDLTAMHGFGANVTEEQMRQLSSLPARLDVLRNVADAETARAARVLSLALGEVTPEPLPGVQVLNVSNEYPEGPGRAAVDGVWNSTDLKTMWYHPVPGESQIVLDLGEERTVTGVVIWNFNQSGGQFRGWKRAEVYVSPTPTALTPIADGIVPMAPGVNEPADYGTFIGVPCVTGRFVKLKAKELWNVNSYTGLAEVQVLGF